MPVQLRIAALTALFAAATLAAGCGDEDGPRLVVDPASLSLSGVHGGLRITAVARITITPTPGRRVFVYTESEGTGLLGVGLYPYDGYTDMVVDADPTRSPGHYQGTVSVVACWDDQYPCRDQLAGSPARVPFTVEITGAP